MVADVTAYFSKIHLGQRSVIWPAGSDHYMVNRPQVTEEPVQGSAIVGVKRGAARGVDLLCGVLQALGISAC
jgi:hypothetical protein